MRDGARVGVFSRSQAAGLLADVASGISLRQQRFSPSKLAVLVEVLAEAGVPADVVLAGTGLDAAAIANPFALTSSLQFLTAARNAVRHCSATDLGVRVGRRLHASCYGMYGYAMLCSESMTHCAEIAVKYHQLANGLLQIQWVEDADMSSWIFPGRSAVTLPDMDTRLYRFLIELQFAAHVTITKDAMGDWCVPARAQFTEPEPPHAAVLSGVLECPIAFGQSKNVLSYPSAWLARTPHLANPITAAQVSAQCARLLEDCSWQAGITRRVYQELTRKPGHFPEIDQIAEGLCMTSRTLRRKLEAEGTSYAELLTSVRKALAIDYLCTTVLSTEDIAQALGFSDAVGFRHAFKRWTGYAPNEYRRERPAGGILKPARN